MTGDVGVVGDIEISCKVGVLLALLYAFVVARELVWTSGLFISIDRIQSMR